MSALESAYRLTGQGLAVFPVGRDKVPLVKGWTTGAATNADDVDRLFARFPDAPCVGVSAGQSDLLVVDVDPQNGGDDAMGRWLMDHGNDWQNTPTVITPRGGRHYYFRADGKRFRTTTGVIAPGVDTRGTGGQVVAPMSVSEHGTYHWEGGYGLDERPLLPVPEWIAALAKAKGAQPTKSMGRGAVGDLMQVRDIPYLHQKIVSPLSDGRLREIASDEMLMRYVGTYLGIGDVPLGTAFICVLHAENKPSAALYRDRNGVVMYHDFHAQGTALEWLTLAEVYAAQIAPEVRKLNGPEHATWMIRLLVDAGLIDPAPVPMRPLPAGASDSTRKVYEGIKHLFACKWLYSPGEPSPLAWRFTSGWCSVAQQTAQNGIQALVRDGIIAPVGEYRATYGRTMITYLPVRGRA